MPLTFAIGDEDLKGLQAALDPKKLARLIAAARGAEPPVRVVSAEIVRHRPGRRCVLRYEYRNPDGSSRTLFGKLYRNRHGAATAEVHAALGMLAVATEGFPQVPDLVAYLPRERLLLCRSLPGTPLRALLGTAGGRPAAERTGRALAALHHAAIPIERVHGGDRERAALDAAMARLRSVHPGLAAAVGPIARTLEARSLREDHLPYRIVHRDFHPAQVLVDGAAVSFLDLDKVAWGDPAIDVGNFLAHLTLLEARPGAYAEECADFLGGYRSARGPASDERISMARAATLVRLASLEPPESPRAADMIAEAARLRRGAPSC